VCVTTAAVPKTLFDKIWDTHVVGRRHDGRTLIYMDRHVIDDVRAPHGLQTLAQHDA
jgi:3-isopropylmalate/(R)-2-methylmalate dehydratase large subunit